jgi:hypothetical protein
VDAAQFGWKRGTEADRCADAAGRPPARSARCSARTIDAVAGRPIVGLTRVHVGWAGMVTAGPGELFLGMRLPKDQIWKESQMNKI